ncbi:MAG: hypothetical protein NTX24_00930 [Candidatus Pacearchaeota archaeon]|nr:hypothetical protein [Candidatus Pacearchaeota archaeon]
MAKGEKRSRKKRVIRQIGSLLKRAEEHRIKAETMPGEKDTTPAYWIEEAERFEQQAKEREDILKRLEKKKVMERKK